ncbi:hydroxymethylglutaryl-CoA synthase [Alkalibacterium pelagium]|uniref:Hydroxymethylglutaryl-CoA synthase n=1 Tax=Alkalibacterium pelagium TaxID=426702 RepID=A0A1H7IE59_9LACT|nr:hydroxymethylglutaryl-CoA synthase [Alkalibacterium pelagium]GEN50028.1 hydroxymethylglutaryl-CoA synthase [Alkalibacterium pelagium]SEK59800.1 hydroxymethylglutaryl-CoA synthase [Alkalibacterium pelagium]
MDIGIDKIGFYTPNVYVDMEKLAEVRGVDPAKYTIGIGQEKMAIAPLHHDSVSMAANAALSILDDEDKASIDFVLFGSESGVDHSKSGAVWVHQLTGIQKNARCVELKQACYGATAGIKMAMGHIALNPESKVLVLGADIAKYGLKTGGEPTQGAGAVAMVLSQNPRVLSLDNDSASMTKDISDFWRPLYSDYAFVDGKFSNEAYLSFLKEVWNNYKEQTNRELSDFEAMCFHLPYTKMGKKAILALTEDADDSETKRLMNSYHDSIYYNKQVGNVYTGSLYLSLLSLLEQGPELEEGARIGLFSYGSGAVGEFFSGVVKPDYKQFLNKEAHESVLDDRRELSIDEYETILEQALPKDGSDVDIDNEQVNVGKAHLAAIKENIRVYAVK